MLRRRPRSPSASSDIIDPVIKVDWSSLMYCKKSNNDCMLSATKTKNYLMDDPFCDWLNLYHASSGFQPKETPGFLADLYKKGYEFEDKIMDELVDIYKTSIRAHE